MNEPRETLSREMLTERGQAVFDQVYERLTAIDHLTAHDDRARQAYQRDIRFRSIVQSVVAREMQGHGPVDPDHADREAYDIATAVAARLLQAIYEDDAELAAQKAMADRYRKLAEDALLLQRPPPFILKSATDTP